jgi:hypothetical protein
VWDRKQRASRLGLTAARWMQQDADACRHAGVRSLNKKLSHSFADLTRGDSATKDMAGRCGALAGGGRDFFADERRRISRCAPGY